MLDNKRHTKLTAARLRRALLSRLPMADAKAVMLLVNAGSKSVSDIHDSDFAVGLALAELTYSIEVEQQQRADIPNWRD